MKRMLSIFLIMCIATACKKNKPLSLEEQIEGKWQISSYSEEQWQPATQRIDQWDVDGRPGDYIDFTQGKMDLHFGQPAPIVWPWSIVDQNILEINGRKWNIVKLTPDNFQLSQVLMNAMYKIRDTIRFDLVRP